MIIFIFFCFVLIQLSDGTSIKSSSNLFFSAKKKEAPKRCKAIYSTFFFNQKLWPVYFCMSLRNKEKLRFRLESWRKKHLVVFILLLFVLYNVFCCLFSTDKCSLIKNLLNWYSDPDSALDSLFRSITNFTYVCSSRSLYRKDIHSIVVCVWCCFFVVFFVNLCVVV